MKPRKNIDAVDPHRPVEHALPLFNQDSTRDEQARQIGRYVEDFKSAKKKEYSLRYREKHRDRVVASQKRYYEKNKDAIRAKTKRYSANNKDKALEAQKRYATRNPHKMKARKAVFHAVRAGKLLRQPCVECGADKVEAHHPDYSKPLEIIWLCPTHHYLLHSNQVALFIKPD